MLKVFNGLVIGLMLAAVPALAQDSNSDSGAVSSDALITLPKTIHIDEALLGRDLASCDVSQPVKQRCEGRTHCEIVISKDLCPAKHLPGLLQPLQIDYHCRVGEMPRTVIADEPNRLRLVCVSNPNRKD
jgi:hypothetical protein